MDNAVPVSNGVSVLNAPEDWMSMTPEQLKAFIQQKTGKDVPVAKVATPVADAPPVPSSRDAVTSAAVQEEATEKPKDVMELAKELVQGGKIDIPTEYGNLASNPTVEFLGSGALEVPDVDDEQVQRILRGLNAAYEEEAEDRKSVV